VFSNRLHFVLGRCGTSRRQNTAHDSLPIGFGAHLRGFSVDFRCNKKLELRGVKSIVEADHPQTSACAYNRPGDMYGHNLGRPSNMEEGQGFSLCIDSGGKLHPALLYV